MVMIKAISDAGSTSTEMKKTKGKRKIDIKFIKDDNSRLVTFTKRRTGLFKKAAEICVLTGAEIAVIVSSPGDRISYAFRHPNDVVIDRYLNNTNKDATTTQNSPPPLPMKEFNQHYVEVSKEVEAEKKRRESIPVNIGGIRWYDEDINGLEVDDLQGYLCSLAELKKKVLIRADELLTINKSSAFFGSNLSQLMEWNNGSQPVNVPTNGGFNFQDGGDNGNFSSIPASFVFN